MKYIIYDTKHKVYDQGITHVAGLKFRHWGYDKDKAQRYTKPMAMKLAKQRKEYQIEEVVK